MIWTRRLHLVVSLEGQVLRGERLPAVPLASFAGGGGGAPGVVLPDVLALLLEVTTLRAPALPAAPHLSL